MYREQEQDQDLSFDPFTSDSPVSSPRWINVGIMFEDFAFDKRAEGAARPDPEPNIDPHAVPTDWFPVYPPATVATSAPIRAAKPSAATIDRLAHQMSRQSLIPRSECNSNLVGDSTGDAPFDEALSVDLDLDLDLDLDVDLDLELEPTVELGPATSGDIGKPSLLASDATTEIGKQQPQQHQDKIKQWADCADSLPSPPTVEYSAVRRSLSPRVVRESLVEMMITHGVQCSVHAPASHLLSGNMLASPSDRSLGDLIGDVDIPLEIDDINFREEEEAMLRSIVSLRQAAGPGGVRRLNGLKYCTSSEAALKSKNLKRNKIKMRKRPKSRSSSTSTCDRPLHAVVA
ncbi:hypothetical protein BX600DRAFT_509901 [Xylariales sp. PMI_506]|nr:hypothetical protein BX600DRAFT_509901 [Xylariales sp. PMI_506]